MASGLCCRAHVRTVWSLCPPPIPTPSFVLGHFYKSLETFPKRFFLTVFRFRTWFGHFHVVSCLSCFCFSNSTAVNRFCVNVGFFCCLHAVKMGSDPHPPPPPTPQSAATSPVCVAEQNRVRWASLCPCFCYRRLLGSRSLRYLVAV